MKVTEGTNTKDEKAAFLRGAYAAAEAVLGPVDPASYIVIQEVRADAWGYAGATQEQRYIESRAPAAGARDSQPARLHALKAELFPADCDEHEHESDQREHPARTPA